MARFAPYVQTAHKNMFQLARRRLTGWYLLIIMVIIGLFSMTIYTFLAQEVDRFDLLQRQRFGKRMTEDTFRLRSQFVLMPQPDPNLVKETKKRIFWSLIIIDSVILVISGGLGYILAGKQLQPIQTMVEEQQQFVSDSSHELRTPLTSLKAAFEVYLRGKQHNVTESKVLIQESLEEVNKLQTLAEALLSLAQHQNSSSALHAEKTTTTEILRKAIKSTKAMADKKHITLQQHGENIGLFVNQKAVTDVIVILLDNAIKYSQASSTVTITTALQKNNAIISVADQGIGIEEKDQRHIFDRFFRADTARSKTDGGGFGLGLSIAKHIVEQHHGNLSVESKKDHGSLFTVKLPTQQSVN